MTRKSMSPERDTGSVSSRSVRGKKLRGETSPEPLDFNRSDVEMILNDLAVTLAPADLRTLLAHEEELRGQVPELEREGLSLLASQLLLALDCLRDHVEGRCPQIPYHTIAVLGAAVYYFGSIFDIIPDFLERLGHLDDAAVMALAFEKAEKGIRRYCAWKRIDPGDLLPGGSPHTHTG